MTFTSKAYLTIDDSPSTRMDDLIDYLEKMGIPAIFYCRGDFLEENTASAIRALQKGFVLANHTYSHQRASEKDFAWIVDDIERCEKLLEEVHAVAQVRRKGKYFRFPHMDRGAAGWIVDYDRYPAEEKGALFAAFTDGLNIKSMDRPGQAAFDKKDRLQRYLASAGYTQPFKGVTHPWFAKGEIASAHDCLYTFSNCDWMLTARHSGKWPYKSVNDLKEKALSDPFLRVEGGVNVILAHDQAEIVDVTMELVDHLARNGVKFLEV